MCTQHEKLCVHSTKSIDTDTLNRYDSVILYIYIYMYISFLSIDFDLKELIREVSGVVVIY